MSYVETEVFVLIGRYIKASLRVLSSCCPFFGKILKPGICHVAACDEPPPPYHRGGSAQLKRPRASRKADRVPWRVKGCRGNAAPTPYHTNTHHTTPHHTTITTPHTVPHRNRIAPHRNRIAPHRNHIAPQHTTPHRSTITPRTPHRPLVVHVGTVNESKGIENVSGT